MSPWTFAQLHPCGSCLPRSSLQVFPCQLPWLHYKPWLASSSFAKIPRLEIQNGCRRTEKVRCDCDPRRNWHAKTQDPEHAAQLSKMPREVNTEAVQNTNVLSSNLLIPSDTTVICSPPRWLQWTSPGSSRLAAFSSLPCMQANRHRQWRHPHTAQNLVLDTTSAKGNPKCKRSRQGGQKMKHKNTIHYVFSLGILSRNPLGSGSAPKYASSLLLLRMRVIWFNDIVMSCIFIPEEFELDNDSLLIWYY